jgi:RHS repeat-associated protein
VGQSYSVPLSATGGVSPYTWSNVGNALPSGLALSAAGVISGTPAAGTAGTVSLTIQARDNNHLITQALLNIKVDSSVQTMGPVYSYSATYDGVGNVNSYTDSVMGAWNFQYDTLNRLATGNATTGDYDGQYACWNYDSFGNRQQQVLSSVAFLSGSGGASGCQPPATAYISTDLATYTSSNQIAETNAPGVSAAPGYDAAGNITSDGVRSYLYDAEGRICAVAYTPIAGGTSYYGYEYDAEGNRVAKGTITTTTSTWSCDPSANGLSYTESYVLSPSGQQLTTLDGNGHWQRTNVYASDLLATYDTTNLHFHLSDPLGTRRVQTSAAGFAETDCERLPFGDELTCFADPNAPSSADDSTPLHFTGKERDTESGNDYFGARYYASSMGRWLSPDPAGVAFSNLSNPQSWNLYSYVLNNPLIGVDPDGRECVWSDGSFDSKDDPDTGSIGGCQNAGGVYYDPSTFTAGNGQDWSAAPNAELAGQYQEAMDLAAQQATRSGPKFGDEQQHFDKWHNDDDQPLWAELAKHASQHRNPSMARQQSGRHHFWKVR